MSDTEGTVSGIVLPPAIPARNGGTLNPWQAGRSGNPGGLSKRYAEARAALRNWCCDEGVQRMIELANDEDTRVAAMMTNAAWDRAFGKPKEYDASEDAPRTIIDLSRMTSAQLALVRNMIDSGAIRPAKEEPQAETVSAERSDD